MTTEDKRIRAAMQAQAALENAEGMGTPMGLRNLFPTNLMRMRMRHATPLERTYIMASKQPAKTDETRTDTPSANAGKAQELERRSAGDPQGGEDPTTAQPRGPAPTAREYAQQQQEQGDEGTPVTDPGPPPNRPTYTGMQITPTVDMLLMAAEAEDRDALAAIRTINEPPEVAQYKANLLEWLDRVEGHRVAVAAAKNANTRSNPDVLDDVGSDDEKP